MEHIELVGIGLTHHLKSAHGFPRLNLVDLAHGQTNVNQDPITGPDAIWTHQRHTHVAFHARDIYFSNGICIVHNVYDLTRNTKTHVILLCKGTCKGTKARLYIFDSRAAATASWPRLMPPSLGGTRRLIYT